MSIYNFKDKSSNEISILEQNYSYGKGFIKFSNGTLICYGSFSAVDVPRHSYKDYEEDYAYPFVSTPFTICSLFTASLASEMGYFSISVAYEDSRHIKLRVFSEANNERSPVPRYLSIGRWK